MNPCRCGWLGDPGRECTRAPRCAVDYQAKISGPLLDRIDLQVDVPPVAIADLVKSGHSGENSATVAARVATARTAQAARFAGGGEADAGTLNATMNPAQLERYVKLEDDASALLAKAAESLKLSARAYHRLLRVARTIADLDGAPDIVARTHVAEALSYRRFGAA
jgi:magnesium chelatase family protein